MPQKSTKHIAKPQNPIGWVKDGKVKIKDGDSGKVGWRSARRGFAGFDYDGEPTSQIRGKEGIKENRTHTVHRGRRSAKTNRRSE